MLEDLIIVKTRYGKETHWGDKRGSVTWCGVWLKANGIHFQVRAAKLPTCEKCAARGFAALS